MYETGISCIFNYVKDLQFNLEESIGYLLGRSHRNMANKLQKNFRKIGYDISLEQWIVLVTLNLKDGQNQQEIADFSCKDKTSITRLINGLEKHGLVMRVTDKTDKRNRLIFLTDKGKLLKERLFDQAKITVQEATEGIDPADLETCKKVLKKIFANVV